MKEGEEPEAWRCFWPVGLDGRGSVRQGEPDVESAGGKRVMC